MKITAFANFLDPQTLPMYDALDEQSSHQLIFAATEPMEEELLQKGYPDYHAQKPYVIKLYEESDPLAKAAELAAESDVLIYGHCPADYFNLAVKSGKPVFRLSQHIYRDGKTYPLKWKASYFVKHTLALIRKPVYLLCLGTYTAYDFSLSDSYAGKRFEFGEFTEVIDYDPEELQKAKQTDPVTVVWANPLHPWYEPDTVIELAKELTELPVKFTMYGQGELAGQLRQKAESLPNLQVIEDDSLETVDHALKHADIFLTTSSYNDGWGSILNRAMNRACACVVSTAVGASKMIGRNETGLLYEYGNSEDLKAKVMRLVEDSGLRRSLGEAAYTANREVWNGTEAGNRLYALMEALSEGKPSPFAEGLCSPAQIVTKAEMKQRAETVR